jgi:hypothetical protein
MRPRPDQAYNGTATVNTLSAAGKSISALRLFPDNSIAHKGDGLK